MQKDASIFHQKQFIMSNKSVNMVPIETNKRLSGDAGKAAMAITPSKNALPADQAEIISTPDFKTSLPLINQEARLIVNTPEGDIEINHRFETEADLEANSQVESTMLEKAGALFRIPQTRAMLIKKAFLSEWSKQLKDAKSKAYYASLLEDDTTKHIEIQNLRTAAAHLRSLNLQNL